MLKGDGFAHAAGNLFKHNRGESAVEPASNVILPENACKVRDEARRKAGLGDHPDPHGLEWTERNIRDESCDAGANKIDRGSSVDGLLRADPADERLFPELVAAKLQAALHKISREQGPSPVIRAPPPSCNKEAFPDGMKSTCSSLLSSAMPTRKQLFQGPHKNNFE